LRRRSIIQMVLVGLVVGAAVALVALLIPWLPTAASTEAGPIDQVYWFVTGICIFVFALVAAVSAYSVWKFRAAPDDHEDGKPIHGNTRLEIIWTLVPTILVTAISIYSGIALASVQEPSPDARTIKVTAQQFAWNFAYPNLSGRSTGDLVVQVDKPVVLEMTSKDVIHSFWVPQFRMKQDVVPGINTQVPFTPTKVGTFPVICTELCGLGHPTMRAEVRVLSAADYATWASQEKGGTATTGAGGGDAGKAAFEQFGCSSCHTLADAGSTAQVGPDLDKVLKGKDADFVRTSIVDPNKEIATGYQPGVMPQEFGDQVPEQQLDALVDYLVKATNG